MKSERQVGVSARRRSLDDAAPPRQKMESSAVEWSGLPQRSRW